MPNELPYLPIFTGDIMSAVASWPAERVGAYCLALFYQWEHGSVPTKKASELGLILHVGASRARTLWVEIAVKFRVDPNTGLAQNTRLEQVRAEVRMKVATAKEKGQAGAEERWKRYHARLAAANAQAPAQASAQAERGYSVGNGIQNQTQYSPPLPPAARGDARADLKPPTRKEREWAEATLREYEVATGSACPHEPDCNGQLDRCVGALVQAKRVSEAKGQKLVLTHRVAYKKAGAA